jgi:hypothetical protein
MRKHQLTSCRRSTSISACVTGLSRGRGLRERLSAVRLGQGAQEQECCSVARAHRFALHVWLTLWVSSMSTFEQFASAWCLRPSRQWLGPAGCRAIASSRHCAEDTYLVPKIAGLGAAATVRLHAKEHKTAGHFTWNESLGRVISSPLAQLKQPVPLPNPATTHIMAAGTIKGLSAASRRSALRKVRVRRLFA